MQTQNPQIGILKLSSPVILAPMAGITNLPYRRIMKRFGAGLVFSEMISANGLIHDGRKTRALLESHKDEFPLGIQLFGDNSKILSQAAEQVIEKGSLLDINMGCPVKKVISSGAGSALLKEPKRIAAILSHVRKAYPGPLTIKIRSGWDEHSLNYLEVGHIAENEGVNAITLHPRTRSQGFSGKACWNHLAELKAALNIPVFGSGDIFTAEDAIKMFQKTACDAVMIGRGGYGNPWIISQILGLLTGVVEKRPEPHEIYQVALEHLALHQVQFGERKALLEMRKHLCWYARGISGASFFRSALQKTENLLQVRKLTETFFDQDHAA